MMPPSPECRGSHLFCSEIHALFTYNCIHHHISLCRLGHRLNPANRRKLQQGILESLFRLVSQGRKQEKPLLSEILYLSIASIGSMLIFHFSHFSLLGRKVPGSTCLVSSSWNFHLEAGEHTILQSSRR